MLLRGVLAVMVLSATLQAATITNGDFESGLAGWTVADQTDPLDPPGTNTFFAQTGSLSPVNLLPVAAPPSGSTAAMTDSGGPGSHLLYQDFLVPLIVIPSTIRFSLYVNNLADDYFAPSPENSLAFGTMARNQQARVDILAASADPFSVAPGDILLNLFLTEPGDPLSFGYQDYSANLTALLQAHAGETLRLRFAQVNNVNVFNFGVDAVSIDAVPEPSSLLLVGGGVLGVWLRRRRWSAER